MFFFVQTEIYLLKIYASSGHRYEYRILKLHVIYCKVNIQQTLLLLLIRYFLTQYLELLFQLVVIYDLMAIFVKTDKF